MAKTEEGVAAASHLSSNQVLPQQKIRPAEALQSALRWMNSDIEMEHKLVRASGELLDYPELAEFLRDPNLLRILQSLYNAKMIDLDVILQSVQTWVGSPHQQVSQLYSDYRI